MSIKLQFALVGLSLAAAIGAAVVVPWGQSPYKVNIVDVGHSPYEANIVADGDDEVHVIDDSQLTNNTFGSEVSGFPSGRRDDQVSDPGDYEWVSHSGFTSIWEEWEDQHSGGDQRPAKDSRDSPLCVAWLGGACVDIMTYKRGTCVDVSSKCEHYKGKCDDDGFDGYTRRNCMLTCGLCDYDHDPCRDLRSDCDYLKGTHKNTNTCELDGVGILRNYMTDVCKFTCGLCAECFETRVGYAGRNLPSQNPKGNPYPFRNPEKLPNVKHCQAKCKWTEGCNFFTYFNKQCTLMSEVYTKGPDETAISGSKQHTCAENGTPMFGMIQQFEPRNLKDNQYGLKWTDFWSFKDLEGLGIDVNWKTGKLGLLNVKKRDD